MSRISVCVAALLFAPATAGALDIDEIGMYWVHDRIGGTPVLDPFGIEFDVVLNDDSGIDNIQVVTPTGTVDLDADPFDSNSWEIAGTETTRFASIGGGSGLFDVFPNTGAYQLQFLNGAIVVDSYAITFSAGDFDQVTDFLDISNPAHLGSYIVGSPITWSCSDQAPLNGTCDGNRILGDSYNITADTDGDFFDDPDTNRTTWTPAGIVAGDDYEFELIIGDYGEFLTADTSDVGGDAFTLFVGYESISIVEATAVPEPGTAALVASGLVIIGVARRRTR